MEIKLLQTGPLGVNTLIVPLVNGKVFVVDPASCAFSDDETAVSRYLAQEQLDPVAIVLTHGHFDHVSGLPFLSKTYPNIQIVIHREDAEMIGAASERLQGSMLSQMGFSVFLPSVTDLPAPTGFLEAEKTLADCIQTEDEAVKNALSCWKVFHTPGHSRGSCCLYNETEKLLISGDTLFYQSWGRTDLYGGSESQIQASLRGLVKKVPSDTRVYPGHDYSGFPFTELF